MTAWHVDDLGPDVIRLIRALLILAVVGGAVLLTGQLMQRAQAPAKAYLTGGK